MAENGRGHILVVEPMELVTIVMKEILCEAGYDVTVVRNGAEALAVLGRTPPPDIVLTETGLKGVIQGYDVAAEARRAETPCMFISTTVPDLARLEETGAGYLLKPLTNARLLQAVEALGEQNPRLSGSPSDVASDVATTAGSVPATGLCE